MDAVHPPDELRPKLDDVLHRMADPRFGGIEDLGVAVDGRHERAHVHLRISEPADEDAGGRRSVHLHAVDHRGGLHHEVPADEDRAARLATEELCASALDAQPARDGRPRVRVEDRRERGRRRLDRVGEHRRLTDRRRLKKVAAAWVKWNAMGYPCRWEFCNRKGAFSARPDVWSRYTPVLH